MKIDLRSLLIGLGLTGICSVLVAFWLEPASLSIKNLTVETTDWPADTAPLKAVLISDVHVDDVHMPPQRVHAIVKQINDMKPDVILLAGDYIGGDFANAGTPRARRSAMTASANAVQEEGLQALTGLRARTAGLPTKPCRVSGKPLGSHRT